MALMEARTWLKGTGILVINNNRFGETSNVMERNHLKFAVNLHFNRDTLLFRFMVWFAKAIYSEHHQKL